MYPDNSVNRGGYASPSQRGRGLGSPSRGYESPRGRGRGRGDSGFDSPRGRGRGRGGPKLRPDAPLSKLLYEERPLLRPIKFVRSVHHATLFQEEEELLQAVVEDVGDEEQSHVPTADRVARVFSGGNIPRIESENEEESLEEIDFEDLAKVREEVDAAASLPTPPSVAVEAVEEQFLGIFINKPPPMPTAADSPMPEAPQAAVDSIPGSANIVDSASDAAVELVVTAPAELPSRDLFYVDTTPTPVEDNNIQSIAIEPARVADAAPIPVAPVDPPPADLADLFYVDTTPTPIAAGPEDIASALAPLRARPADDEEVIVYVAPHPRTGRASPAPLPVPPPSLSSTSVLTGTAIVSAPELHAGSAPAPSVVPALAFASVAFDFTPSPKKARRQAPVFTVHGQAKARTKARVLARRVERRGTFGSLGARAAEAQLRGDDPRRDERRRGDSDVDWGDSDDGPEEDGGMDVDVELDAAAMQRFATGMGPEGGRFMTMDDIHDEERMREEDEDEGGAGTSDEEGEEGEEDESEEDEEVDAIVAAEEGIMVAEPRDLPGNDDDDDDEEEDDSDDNEQSPRTGFQARLERLRKAARERGPDDSLEFMEGDDSDDDFLEGTWADRDEDFASQIQAILDENGDILSSTSRQGRKKLLKAVANGEIVDFEEFAPAKRGKKKRDGLPAELQAVWDKDRVKKAENKRLRALARLEAAADPLAPHKGGKKGRKAMLAAARRDPTITVLPNRVVDMTTLVQQIRRFVGDIGGPVSMSLPPTDKTTRKNIHEMAIAFNLKSVSKGKGDARYTTLTKTTRTGLGANEAKVAKIARRGGAGAAFVKYDGKARAAAMPRHRDGDEVGKAAPKIGETNIGFKMLASMGWAEGERIGVSADGLHIPLTAVIKNTKLGLGATR
ncbi:hypothetical protein FB451DRAFT_1259422 [Mycena latifolia]|nr:hypothetical protein FB451DRAFT_1259422 [Mycena latifolia]